MRFSGTALAADLGGTFVPDVDGPADVVVDGVAIDSRELRAGQLFAAVQGARDGHDFVPAAVAAGAGAVLVERPIAGVACVVVPSVPMALTRLGGMSRRRLPDRVIGITGSVGKTTCKDLLASVLARRFATAASVRSFNNELGVPLTLANAPDGTEAAVVEMGARGHGHIALLCSTARPTVGIELVVAPVHVETMGGLDQIMVAKRELVEALPADGLAVLNAGDPRVLAMADHTRAAVLTFGVGGEVRARDVSVDDDLHATCTVESPWGSASVRLGVRGEHNVANALAATAAALWLGVPLDGVVDGLADPAPSPWRMELTRTAGGITVLNDAYNASPTSMAAALRSLASLDASRRVAVVGLMAELGDQELDGHRSIAALADELGIELLPVGTDRYGREPVDGPTAAVAALGELAPGTAVLVKGSRVAGLEAVATALLS
jgi:UDP-N-acetylmuramoyl-tripeptide--D-alanyl-D-alanine ligase